MPAAETEFLQRLRDSIKVVPISAATATITVAVASTRKFVIYHVYLSAIVATTVVIRSGANDLSGALPIAANSSLELEGQLTPVFIGSALGEDIVIFQGAPQQIEGFVVYQELQTIV